MILVPQKPMPADNPADLKRMSNDLAITIKSREHMVEISEEAAKVIHRRQLEKYKAQKAEIDARLSSLTKPAPSK